MLSIKNVSKAYSNNFKALSNFNLDVENGIVGLLGSNGAGKSTLMKMVATILKPSRGNIYWNAKDIHKHGDELRHDLGYLPQNFGVFPNLNAIEFLRYMAALKGMNMRKAKRRIDELIVALNLNEAANRSIGSYSGGMKQRVGIAQALLNDPKLLIVDEPTASLDPDERMNFRNLISALSKDKIVILSTHIISDVEVSAEKIVLLKKGKLIYSGAIEKLLASLEGKVWEYSASSEEIEKIKSKYITGNIIRRSNEVTITVISEEKPAQNAHMVKPTLENAYLYYMHSGRGALYE